LIKGKVESGSNKEGGRGENETCLEDVDRRKNAVGQGPFRDIPDRPGRKGLPRRPLRGRKVKGEERGSTGGHRTPYAFGVKEIKKEGKSQRSMLHLNKEEFEGSSRESPYENRADKTAHGSGARTPEEARV